MSKTEHRPIVGIGVIIENSEKQILIGKRKGDHAPYYSIPGGHLEMGESFEEAAIREIAEECNLRIFDPKVISITNNLKTYKQEGKHSVSVILLVTKFEGQLLNLEPHKCESWEWFNTTKLPKPHFDASEMGIFAYINNVFYSQ